MQVDGPDFSGGWFWRLCWLRDVVRAWRAPSRMVVGGVMAGGRMVVVGRMVAGVGHVAAGGVIFVATAVAAAGVAVVFGRRR